MKTLKTMVSVTVLLAFFGFGQVLGQWGTNGTHIYNTNTGNVGIGNNSPAKLLYVGKNMTEPTITIRNFGGSGGSTFQMLDDVSGADWKFKATNDGGFKIRDNANGLDVITIAPNTAANSLSIGGGGNVFIGIQAWPGNDQKLYVHQTAGTAICGRVYDAGGMAIYGVAEYSAGESYGVRGVNFSDNGAGGYFTSNTSTGVNHGVFGQTSTSVLPSCGVAGYALYGGIGVGAWSWSGDLIRAYSGSYYAGTLRFYITQGGAVYADGGFNTFKKVQSQKGEEEYRVLNSMQVTESWIEDIGSARLVNGQAEVNIEPVFAQTVDLSSDYKVFLTPVSEEMVFLVVSGKRPSGFTVKGIDINGRPAACSFDYRIVARDSDKPNARMEVVNIPEPIDVPRGE